MTAGDPAIDFTRMQSVRGAVSGSQVLCADAHCHLWIAPRTPSSPALMDVGAAAGELRDFADAGGGLVLDCQPGDCERDGNVLAEVAAESTVTVIASTGFHLQRYYRAGTGPWSLGADAAYELFLSELRDGLLEAPQVRAGAIKTAWTGEHGVETGLMRAALAAALETGVAVVVHTERGNAVESLTSEVAAAGLPSSRVQISHLDKRPDLGLHRQLAAAGFILGYDAFLRPQYDPERNVWPLLRQMVAHGHWNRITLGLDLVSAADWSARGGPGLRTLPLHIVPRLRAEGVAAEAVAALSAGNVVDLLSIPSPATIG